MATLYDPSMYDDRCAVPSYREATAPAKAEYQPFIGEERCDVAIIGGGYTGLSAALHLARDYHIDVRVLEAGPIGWGVSGRNGGFCCFGANKLSIAKIVRRFGLDETKRFYAAQVSAINLVDSLRNDEGIDYDRQGDGTFEVAHNPRGYRELEEVAAAFRDQFGIPVRLYEREAFAQAGHESTEQFGALHIGKGFGLHPLRYVTGLAAAAAARRGAVLHPASRVLSWEPGSPHRLRTVDGVLCADRVVVATNGFTRGDLHPAFRGRFLPAISNIVATRPLSVDELDAQGWRTDCPVSNTRSLLFYYRVLPDRTFIIGARGDPTGRSVDGEKRKRWMVRRLGEVFPAWREVPIAHFWRGFVCITARLTPAVGRLVDDPSVFYGYGYHGNGVAAGTWTGRILARLVTGVADAYRDIPAPMAGLPRRLPGGSLRRWALPAAYAWYRLTDDR